MIIKRVARRMPLVAIAGMLAVVGAITPASSAVSVNSLSGQGTMGRIRVRPVFQDTTGATKLQVGDANNISSRPNRTVGDDVIPMIENSPGLRIAGNNPFAADGHTHYHAGDTAIVVNDVSGFAYGDTIHIGSPNCNFPYIGLTCRRFIPGVGNINEQPFGQVNYIVGGDVGSVGPGLLYLATGLTASPRCFTPSFGACAFVEGQQVVKMPTMYPGQQFRVDIQHTDIVYGSPNDVVVTAEFTPPQGSNDPNYPRRPLALNKDNPNDFDVIIDNACGAAGCGAGFVSFYIPKEITGTGTVGRTFSVENGDTWYTVYVKAVDATNPSIIRSDGVVRFKLNPTAIIGFAPDKKQIAMTETVTIAGKLRDNTSGYALANIPVEDVIMDIDVIKPSGMTSRYAATSCVDVNPGPTDTCGTNPFGGPGNNHGGFAVKVGGLSGLFIGLPNVGSSTLNCSAGRIVLANPSTYTRLLDVPECILAPIFSATDTLETGTYDVRAYARNYAPPVTAATTFDVVFPF